jgi:F-type H+-transporting ATPase subunit a
VALGGDPNEKGPHGPAVKYDFLVVTALLWLALAAVMVSAAKKAKIRPEGKPASIPNLVEAAVANFQDYLVGVMGEPLARKYTPLLASFFFTILVSNWLGLVPGLLAPTSIPAIPIAISLVAFLSVHIIAIKEAGFKSWFMHFVGDPVWLAPLNFPLHLVGELIKPLSLSLRLLCNVFGEEQVVATLIGLAITVLPAWLPIPFQLPVLFLGTFFGFLQALVFTTLLAIYVSILATHHDDHDAHNTHGHVDHEESNNRHRIVAHPSEMTVG